MENGRQKKVNELLHHHAAQFVQIEANTNPLITITRATVSPDLRNATVYFTTIPDDREQDALIFLKRSGSNMRRHIMKHTKIKIVPHLDFSVDYGERHRQHIDELVEESGIKSTYEVE